MPRYIKEALRKATSHYNYCPWKEAHVLDKIANTTTQFCFQNSMLRF